MESCTAIPSLHCRVNWAVAIVAGALRVGCLQWSGTWRLASAGTASKDAGSARLAGSAVAACRACSAGSFADTDCTVVVPCWAASAVARSLDAGGRPFVTVLLAAHTRAGSCVRRQLEEAVDDVCGMRSR